MNVGYYRMLESKQQCGKSQASGYSVWTGNRLEKLLREHSHYRYCIQLVVVVAAYILGGRVGFAIPLTNRNVCPVWPPAGIALAALLMGGYQLWPAVVLSAFLVNFFTPIPHVAAVGIGIGNTVGALSGVFLLRRIPGFQVALTRLRDVLGLALVGALGGSAISATIGSSVLFLTRVKPWSHFQAAWLMWCVGDAIGVLIIAPLVVAFPKLVALSAARRAEFALLLLTLAAVSILTFFSSIAIVAPEVLVLALVPILLWSAIRFELGGTAAANLLIAVFAVWGTGQGLGPLARSNPFWSAALLQSFLGLVVVPDLALAAVVAERAQIVREQAAREAIQQSEKRYGGILEIAKEGIWMLDSQFRTHFVNHRMAELLGYSVQEMIGRPLFDFLFPEDIERKKADLERRRRGISEELENRYRRKDASELWARVSTAPIFSSEGKFEGAVKWFTEVTDQKRSETERQSALELIMVLSRAVQQTTDSIMITDKNGIIEYVNPAFEAITGFTQAEALGKTPRIVKSGRYGTDFYEKLWGCISQGRPFRGTLLDRKKTGELYWGEQTITPVIDDQGNLTHFVSVVRDVTDSQKRQEQEIQLRLAREVQQRFYTPPLPIMGLDVAAAAYPAEQTGGDYFDVITTTDGALYVCIGDVSGHGLGAALVMALMRAYVRSFAQLQHGVGEILTRLNQMLLADLERGQFATLLLFRVEARHDSMTYANAGHVPGLLFNSDGQLERVLDSTGIPLGLVDNCDFDYDFRAVEVTLKPQQALVLVTDGVTEARNSQGREFGIGGILDYVRSHCNDSAAELVEGLCRAARAFAGSEDHHDDLTSLVLKVNTTSTEANSGNT